MNERGIRLGYGMISSVSVSRSVSGELVSKCMSNSFED